ncbi:hypothetical protein [Phosphitispora sp. TUW77]|uniref:hypothetical protein n=1 Tax=Phosphitispora sp. TUW77 TaxID=3152361 RepID=UPI003AB54920
MNSDIENTPVIDVANDGPTYNGSYFYKLNQELSGQAEIEPYRVYDTTENHNLENDTPN